MFVTRGFKNSLFFVFDFLSNLDCGQWYTFWICKVFQWVPRRHKVLTHVQERLFRKVTSVSIYYFVEWLDTFSCVLRTADVTINEVNHIRCFAIAKYLILLSCLMLLLCGLPPWLSRLRVAIRRRKCPTIQQKNEWTQKWPYEKDTLAGTHIGWPW